MPYLVNSQVGEGGGGGKGADFHVNVKGMLASLRGVD